MLWLAQNGQDPDLAAMLAAGKLHFVAVDTDWKANRPGLTVPDYVYPIHGCPQRKAARRMLSGTFRACRVWSPSRPRT
jgi:hypothetical protein